MKVIVETIPILTMGIVGAVKGGPLPAKVDPYGVGKAKVPCTLLSKKLNMQIQVQGRLTYENPVTFGDIGFDNSATGGPEIKQGNYPFSTQVPNTGTPLMDAVYVQNVGIAKIERFVDNNTGSIIADPSGLFGVGNTNVQFISTFVQTPKRVRVICSSKEVYIGFMDDAWNGTEYNYNNVNLVVGEGGDIPMQPFVVIGKDNTVKLIMEY